MVASRLRYHKFKFHVAQLLELWGQMQEIFLKYCSLYPVHLKFVEMRSLVSVQLDFLLIPCTVASLYWIRVIYFETCFSRWSSDANKISQKHPNTDPPQEKWISLYWFISRIEHLTRLAISTPKLNCRLWKQKVLLCLPTVNGNTAKLQITPLSAKSRRITRQWHSLGRFSWNSMRINVVNR
jgi:hypothetical protein